MKGIKYLVFGYLLLAFFPSQIGNVWAGGENPTTIKIGVLARRGFDECLKEWSPTAQYLTERLPGMTFKIVPLNFREISPAVENNQVDFVIANPFIYVELQTLYGVSRLVTLKRLTPQGYTAHFGGSIFCRADNSEISSLDDLKGHSFAAVDETSFGGWMVAWRELKKAGIDPYRHFKGLTFEGTHDGVVFAVREGKVDAGTVATPILAQMIAEGKIPPNTLKILNVQEETSTSYGISTRLYPEWPFSKLKRTPDDIAEKVAIALLAMPKQSSPAIAAGIAGWTVPFDYTQVQTCMQELQVGIFKNYGKITLTQLFIVYRWQSFSVITVMIILTGMLLYSKKLNQRLQTSEIALLKEMQKRLQANKDLSLANETLNQSQQELANIIDFLPDATFVLDKDKKVITWNRAMEEMTGVSKEAMIGQGDHAYTVPFYGEKRQHILDLLDLEDDEIKKQYKNVSKKGHILYGEDFAPALYNGKGAIIWVTGAPLFDGHGNYFGAIESIRDITERKLVEKEREKLQTLLEQTIEQSPVPMVLVSMPEASFRMVNSACLDFLGISDEPSVIGSLLFDFTPSFQDYDKEGSPGALENLPLSRALCGEKTWNEERRIVRKDGTIRWELVNATPIVNSQGEILAGFLVIIDDTKRKRAEEAGEKLHAQLTQAQKMESVGRLAGGVAHDFNNMLGVIIGYSELILEQVSPSQQFHAELEEIRKAARRSADLTRQLLTFARKQTVAPKVLDLNQTIEGMLNMLRRLIGENINLIWMPGTGLWLAKMDPSQVDQILANLCVNARDAIAGVGKITVETENATFDEEYCSTHVGSIPGEYVRISLSDTGSGMDKETLAHIFEPFFTTKGIGKGTGLGLATVYGAVKQNNGFINAYSEPGQGTTFTIYIPRHVEKTTLKRTIEASESVLGGDELIMLVEDESTLLEMSKTILERLGYTVLAAGTPSEAIRLANEFSGQIHLLATDVIMPEMNGRDLAERLTESRPEMKSLYMSGYTANIIANQGVLKEGVSFIQKPFSKNELAAKVREALES